MAKTDRGAPHEVVLESRHLLGVFFLAVVLAAFFFSMGYFLGRSQVPSGRAAAPQPPAQPAGGPPPIDLTFYERVEGKPRSAPPVRQPETPAPAAETQAVPSASEQATQPIYLQVAAVTQEAEAQRLAKRLEELGFPAVVRPAGADRLHRVQVGPFNSAELADAAARRLQAQGFTDIVRR